MAVGTVDVRGEFCDVRSEFVGGLGFPGVGCPEGQFGGLDVTVAGFVLDRHSDHFSFLIASLVFIIAVAWCHSYSAL